VHTSTGRDNRRGIVHVKSGNVANAETVATVHVWHADRLTYDARQTGHIGNLLHRRNEATHTATLGVMLQLAPHHVDQTVVQIELAFSLYGVDEGVTERVGWEEESALAW
jgi:hypothetical protein